MANKNTKRFRIAVARAIKNGDSFVVRVVNSPNYYSDAKSQAISVPVSQMNKDGVVSCNEKKNMQMRVLRNPGDSRTVHEPIYKGRPYYTPEKGWVYPNS
jgi:hypothetical protein